MVKVVQFLGMVEVYRDKLSSLILLYKRDLYKTLILLI